jgi:hypothetical protein
MGLGPKEGFEGRMLETLKRQWREHYIGNCTSTLVEMAKMVATGCNQRYDFFG